MSGSVVGESFRVAVGCPADIGGRMTRFVPLPDRDRPASAARMWINPEHIVSLVPKVSADGTRHMLRAEIKLMGSPAFDAPKVPGKFFSALPVNGHRPHKRSRGATPGFGEWAVVDGVESQLSVET